MPKKEIALKHSVILFAYLLVVWGVYRFLFRLPEEVEDVLVKPLVWLIPVFILVHREKAKLGSIGITFKNFFPAIYFALSLGAFFAIEGLLVNYFKYGSLNFVANVGRANIIYSLGISFATAVSEEIVFRGFLFSRLRSVFRSFWVANIITTAAHVVINLPIVFFVWKMELPAALIYLSLVTIFGLGAGFVYAKSENIISPILLRVFWEWPIVLFR